jgi:nucleotidyltransferase/DNA polymerase involved in DNA repair
VFEIFHSFTPRVEGLSLDEAFLDVSASQRLFGDRKAIAQRVKAAIFEGAGLTASVGVAHNVSRQAGVDLQKPDGLVCVPADKVHQFLDPMPIGKLWGIGPRTAPKLKAAGILTFGQLRQADPSILATVLGNRAEHFRQLAAGEDSREVIATTQINPSATRSHFPSMCGTTRKCWRNCRHWLKRWLAACGSVSWWRRPWCRFATRHSKPLRAAAACAPGPTAP